jgi:hypothetical protein
LQSHEDCHTNSKRIDLKKQLNFFLLTNFYNAVMGKKVLISQAKIMAE